VEAIDSLVSAHASVEEVEDVLLSMIARSSFDCMIRHSHL